MTASISLLSDGLFFLWLDRGGFLLAQFSLLMKFLVFEESSFGIFLNELCGSFPALSIVVTMKLLEPSGKFWVVNY